MPSIASTLVMSALVLLIAASARPVHGQTASRWSFGLEAGSAEIHQPGVDGGVLGVGVDRRVGSGLLRLQLRLRGSRADEGYVSLTAGPELRLLPDRWITPILAVHGGFLVEPEYSGPAAEISGGLLLIPGRGLGVRATLSRGTHGGSTGPHALLLGVELGFGSGQPAG